MKSKILWIDTETTGINPKVNDIVQLGVIVEIDGEAREEVELFIRPAEGGKIDQTALNTNGLTLEEIQKYMPQGEGLGRLKQSLVKYVDKYDPADKFVPAGFHTRFDTDMLRGLFTKCGDKYYGSWFFNCIIDVQTKVAQAVAQQGLRLKNYKLGTICEAFGVGIDAHDAMSDIKATREIWRILGGAYGA